MPHSQTILRARSVARSMSLPAPVVMWCMNISSAMRPAIRMASCASQVVLVVGVLVVDRQLHGHAQRHAARDDRDFVQRIGIRQSAPPPARGRLRDTRCCVFSSSLMIIDLALGAHQDLVLGEFEIEHA